MPDVIQCFGSEWPYGLIAECTNIPVVIHMQGFSNIYSESCELVYSDWEYIRCNNFNPKVAFTTLTNKKKNEDGLSKERHLMKINRFFMGRTHWDEEIVRNYSPKSKYYYCPEALRPEIYDAPKWTSNKSENINIYNAYNFLLVIACSLLTFMDKPLAKMLFAKDFYSAWKYAPFLMISTVFSGMAAFLGGILSALKKSSLFAKSSVITAVVNTILNIVLVIFIGPLGAAISTAFAYFLMWLIRLKQVKQCIDLRVSFIRDSIAYLVLVVQALALLVISKDTVFCWYQLVFVLIALLLYTKEMKLICMKILAKVK